MLIFTWHLRPLSQKFFSEKQLSKVLLESWRLIFTTYIDLKNYLNGFSLMNKNFLNEVFSLAVPMTMIRLEEGGREGGCVGDGRACTVVLELSTAHSSLCTFANGCYKNWWEVTSERWRTAPPAHETLQECNESIFIHYWREF